MADDIFKIENFEPLFNQILSRPMTDKEYTTKSGIILQPEIDPMAHKGEVLAVGVGYHESNGELIKPIVKVGDIITYPKHGTAVMKIKRETLHVVREPQVFGRFKATAE